MGSNFEPNPTIVDLQILMTQWEKDRCHCDSYQCTAPVLSHDCYRQARKCSEKCGKRKSDSNEKRVPVTAADSDKC